MDADYQEDMDDVRYPPNYTGNQKFKQAKNVFFLRDGNGNKGSIKVAVHPSKYRSLDALLNELTQKMPDLSYGVRSIFTPKGHDRLQSLEDLDNESMYICSQFPNRAKGVDLIKLKKPLMPGIKKSSSHMRFNTASLGNGETELRIKRFKNQERHNLRAPASVPESDSEQLTYNNSLASPNQNRKLLAGFRKADNKRILIKKNGSLDYQQVVLMNRRTMRTFEQFMDDLCGIFLMPVRRLYTLDGKQVESLSAIFNGPDIYVAAGYERFRPLPAWVEEPQPTNSTLLNGSQKPKIFKKGMADRGKWKVRIETSAVEEDSGTSANVYLTIYGKTRATTPLSLNNLINNKQIIPFQFGQIDEFEVTTGNIGRILKIRLHHDNAGNSPDWLLGAVHMENIDTGLKIPFIFNRWLSQKKDTFETCRELAAILDDGIVLPVQKYQITIFTGDCWNAGTEGKVFICIYGENGDTGARQLYHSLSEFNKPFQKESIDTFELEAVCLGRLKKIIIGHNAIEPGQGWFLDKIIIKTISTSISNSGDVDSEAAFSCNRWLDRGENDLKTTIEIKPQDDFRHSQMEKEMWDYERWKFQKGNTLIFYNQVTGKSVQMHANGRVDVEGDEKSLASLMEVVVGDKIDVCSFKSVFNKGKIMTLVNSNVTGGSGRGGSGIDSEFKIHVQPDRTVVLETLRHYHFHLMLNPENSGLIESKGPVTLPGKAFFPYCKGIFRNQSVICFCTSLIQTLAVINDCSLTATGKRNRTAHYIVHKDKNARYGFLFESVVFPNKFLRIKGSNCDCKGSGGNDCLFKIEKHRNKGYITLQAIASLGIYIGMHPNGEVKPVVDTGDKNVRFYPEVIKFGKASMKIEKHAPPLQEIQNSSSHSTENFSFREKSMSPTEINTAQLSNVMVEKEYYTESDWKVFVHSAQNADNCEIIMYVYGEEGCSGPIILGRSGDENNLFLAGAMDEFKIQIPIIGTLFKMRIELKPIVNGMSPFWSLDQVIMENMVTEDRFIFPFNKRLLGRGYEDNELSRETAVLNTDENIPLVKYKVWFVTGTEDGADCNVPISITLFGEYGDCGNREFYSAFIDVHPSFRKGMTDEMSIECVYLGEINKCLVTVHSIVPGLGWYCDKIIVEDPLTMTQICFPSQKWFDSMKGDGATSRYLNAEGFSVISEDNGNSENVDDIHKEAKELIDVITEQAASHVEQFHEMQLKQLQNGHRE